MGADMIVSTAWIRADKQPDVAAAERHIVKLEATPLEDWPTLLPAGEVGDYLLDMIERNGFEDPKAAAAVLRDDLGEFLAGVEGKRRDVTWVDVGPYKVYITGGLSWGDPPTDSMDHWDRLSAAGVLDAMGFYKE